MAFRFRRVLPVVTLLLAVFLLEGSSAFAQTAGGAVRGQVTDPSGSAIAGAHVTVTWPTGQISAADTARDGTFEVKSLPPGSYGVKVTAKGFSPFEVLDFAVAANQVQKLDVTLSIEVKEQKVVVESASPTVDVSPEANVGAIVMTEKDLQALSDDPDELQSDLEALAGPSAGPNGGQIYIDGFTAGQLPPKSAIREIRINQNPFSSEYDKLGYGRIEIFTKPGSNQWHGEVNVQGNTAGFNSKNPFATQEPSYYSTLYNGNIGGPLGKKTSIFFNFQYRNINDISVIHAQGPECLVDASCYSGKPPNLTTVPLSSSVATPRKRLNLGPRVDYQLTPRNTLNVRYQYERNDQSNLGLTGFSLAPQAYESLGTEHQLQIGDTQVFGTNIVNETRFQFLHEPTNLTPASTALQVSVPGAFTDGGNLQNLVLDTQNRYEFQNYTQILHKNHTIKFGVRFREFVQHNTANSSFNGNFFFPSLQAYDATLTALTVAGAPPALQVPGAQFSSICVPTAGAVCTTSSAMQTTATEFDAEPYIQDDWRVRPNLTLSVGLRIEAQTGISDHLDWAPRVALAWGIARGKNPPKTVLRVGSGIFYDRFTQNLILQAERLNGTVQLQNLVNTPCFALPGPSMTLPLKVAECQTLPAPPPVPAAALPTLYRISPGLHAPGVIQTAVVLERQVIKTVNFSLTYLNARGFDQLLTNNINTPLPGTFPGNPVYPLGQPGNVYQYQSEGVFRQNQFLAQVNVRMGAKLTLFGNYVLNYANSDTAGAGSFPSNPFNISQDYGRASFDYRSRFFMGGTIGLPHGFRLSPFVIASTGQPYSITLSQDLIGSSQFNQRPAPAPSSACPVAPSTGSPIVCTPFGAFDTQPAPNQTRIPINSLVAPGRFTMNLRVSKTWGFGALPERSTGGAAGGGGEGPRLASGGGDRGGGRGGPGGPGGFGGFGGGAPTNKRYNLTLSVNARNIFNHTNVQTPTAVLSPAEGMVDATSSPFFARPNQLLGQAYSSGNTASRVVYLQLGFTF